MMIALLMNLGLIPFVIFGFLHSDDVLEIASLGDVSDLLLSYSSLVLVFMSGTLWGQKLILRGQVDLPLYFISNAIMLVVWLSGHMLSFVWIIAVHSILYVLLLAVDLLMFKRGFIVEWYLYNRILITIAIILLFLDYLNKINIF